MCVYVSVGGEVSVGVYLSCKCVCVCVCERERERWGVVLEGSPTHLSHLSTGT